MLEKLCTMHAHVFSLTLSMEQINESKSWIPLSQEAMKEAHPHQQSATVRFGSVSGVNSSV